MATGNEPGTVEKKDSMVCRRHECIFNLCGEGGGPTCNYCSMTGHSKIARYGIQKPENCKAFQTTRMLKNAKAAGIIGDQVKNPKHETEGIVNEDEVRKLREMGIPNAIIAAHYDVSVAKLAEWMRIHKITRPRCLKIDWEQVRKLYDAGMNDEAIAKVMGCKKNTVQNWRCDLKLPRRHKPIEDV